MKQLDLAPHHPIQLRNIDHIKFWFERNDVPAGPSYFPDFDINILSTEINEDYAIIVFSVDSNDTLPDYVVESLKQSGEETAQPAIRFGMTSVAAFQWAANDKESGVRYLQQFITTDTPLLISWPYVRAFLGDFISRSGLPPYHLPLLQIRTKPTDGKQGNNQEAASDI